MSKTPDTETLNWNYNSDYKLDLKDIVQEFHDRMIGLIDDALLEFRSPVIHYMSLSDFDNIEED